MASDRPGTDTAAATSDTGVVDRLRNLAWLTVAIAGLFMVIGGAYALKEGMDARNQVRDKLELQQIVTPEDASIPNTLVNSVETAESMAEIIEQHARESTGGLGYAEMGRFMTPDGDPAGTNDADEAVIGDNGQPVANPLRNVAFQASALQTSLYTSVMAFQVSNLVMGLGLAFILLGLGTWVVGVPTVWAVTKRRA
ncbi:MAG TPA: hypothetical protein VM262_12920 [Acidimicrobiales bacterium]|nr:hypothetical protein [Acidimicrobiales bacterium]